MKINDFARINDATNKLNVRRAAVETQKADKKVRDARDTLVSKLRDTESDEELIEVMVEASENLPVSELLTALLTILNPIVEKLNSEVSDARRAVATLRKKVKDTNAQALQAKPRMDSASIKKFTRIVKDSDTSLEDLKEEAVDLLESFDPASVIEVIVETLPSVVESVLLSNE